MLDRDDAATVRVLRIFLEARQAAAADRSIARVLDVLAAWRHNACADGWYSCSQATEAHGYDNDVACADDDRAGEPCDCGLEYRRRQVMVALARSFASHPDYRAEWEVTTRG